MKRADTETTVELCGREVTLVHRLSARAKHYGITVHPDGRIVATQPRRGSVKGMQRFLRNNAEWIVKHVEQLDELFVVPSRGTTAEYEEYKEQARAVIHAHLEHLNTHYGFTYNRVSIRNQRTRWGSCSQEKNLNFNYQLLFVPAPLREYVVAHELCHLKELNHSARFWKLVAETIPDYRERRNQLRNVVLR